MSTGGQVNSAGRFFINRRGLRSRLGEILNGTAILNNRLYGHGTPEVKDIGEIDETHKTYFASRFTAGIEINYEYYRSPVKTGLLNFGNGNEVSFEIPNVGQQFIGDMVLNIQIGSYGTPNSSTHYRYCDYPGVRLIKKATFTFDNAEIDSYTADDIMFERRFTIDPQIRRAWDQCMGQEIPHEATIYYDDQQVRERRLICDGPQTHKSVQPVLDLWIKLHFEFNNGVKNAFFLSKLSAGKREVRFELEDLGNILYMQPDSTTVLPAVNGPVIQKAFLYTQNLYVDEKIASLYSKTATFRVMRTYTKITRIITDSASNYRLDSLRSPTESIRFGFRPIENKSNPEDWHRYTKISNLNIPIPVSLANGTDPPIIARRNIVVKRELDMFSTVDIGIKSDERIYPELPAMFYHNHLQTRPKLSYAPDDYGSMNISFNVDNSSGHEIGGYLDLSLSDPLILNWVSTSDVINSTYPVELVFSAKILRIMMMQDGRTAAFAQAESLMRNVRPQYDNSS